MTDPGHCETVERVIPAPAEAIFALLADPSRHHDIDGSGSVGRAKAGSQRLQLGDSFGMAMKQGVTYSTVSEIIELDHDRRIAWHTCSPGVVGKVTGGPVWRYELEPVDGGTRVRETWDISRTRVTKPLLSTGFVRRRTHASMEKTLENIEKLLASA